MFEPILEFGFAVCKQAFCPLLWINGIQMTENKNIWSLLKIKKIHKIYKKNWVIQLFIKILDLIKKFSTLLLHYKQLIQITANQPSSSVP